MLTADELRRVVGARSEPAHVHDAAAALAKYLPDHGITDRKEVAAFIASLAVETDFAILEENMDYTASRARAVWPTRFASVAAAKPYARNPEKLANYVYGGRMGNKGRPNAGWLYRGSGLGQTTGYNEFKLMEDATGVPVTTDPDILRRDADLSVLACCLFWNQKKIGAPARAGNLDRVRKLFNGGDHGLAKFKTYYGRALGLVDAAIKGGRDMAAKTKPTTAKKSAAKSKQTKRSAAPKQSPANPKSKILPLFRPKQPDTVTDAVMRKYEYLLPADRRDDAVGVLVVRGYFCDSMGVVGKNDRAMYDDALFLISPDGIQTFNANSDPSVFRKSVATIKAEQAIRYKPGLHGYKSKAGPYPAFRQDADCTVVRDGVGDDTGMFAVNLHRGGVTGTSSLGCLTVPPHQWDEFHGLLTSLLKANDQSDFYVTVLEYAGDRPPVTASQVLVEQIDAENDPSDGVAVALGVSVIAAVAGWYDTISAWVGGFF